MTEKKSIVSKGQKWRKVTAYKDAWELSGGNETVLDCGIVTWLCIFVKIHHFFNSIFIAFKFTLINFKINKKELLVIFCVSAWPGNNSPYVYVHCLIPGITGGSDNVQQKGSCPFMCSLFPCRKLFFRNLFSYSLTIHFPHISWTVPGSHVHPFLNQFWQGKLIKHIQHRFKI